MLMCAELTLSVTHPLVGAVVVPIVHVVVTSTALPGATSTTLVIVPSMLSGLHEVTMPLTAALTLKVSTADVYWLVFVSVKRRSPVDEAPGAGSSVGVFVVSDALYTGGLTTGTLMEPTSDVDGYS
ncbi:MAG TPA: hypothetical protein VKH19_15865 [Gemmatimonadaceae bacterium]|nr:hypothetical protein [Gemmatimonadaceae bacterium]